MLEAYAAIRDQLKLDIVTAWEFDANNVVWVIDEETIPERYPSASVRRLPAIELTPLGPTNDEARLNFEIGGRWQVKPGMDLDLFSFDKAARLRSLLSYPHYTCYGYSPLVASFDYIEGEPGDQYVEVKIVFSVKIVADRRTDADGTGTHTLPIGSGGGVDPV